jgi:hypothetical protein
MLPSSLLCVMSQAGRYTGTSLRFGRELAAQPSIEIALSDMPAIGSSRACGKVLPDYV